MWALIINKKTIIISFIIIVAIICGSIIPTVYTNSPRAEYMVVIDAGHGGIDGGSVGVGTNNTERELNLYYAQSLKNYLKMYGIDVVMTRYDMNGLYSTFSTNKKKDDMQKRKEIILNSGADMVISIHMNSFPASSSRGAQVFYKVNHDSSKHLAESIQSIFVRDIPNARKESKIGDYFILNCSDIPSVIVECGFLSNIEEDKLLGTPKYREKICYAIFCGIIKYLYSEIKITTT